MFAVNVCDALVPSVFAHACLNIQIFQYSNIRIFKISNISPTVGGAGGLRGIPDPLTPVLVRERRSQD